MWERKEEEGCNSIEEIYRSSFRSSPSHNLFPVLFSFELLYCLSFLFFFLTSSGTVPYCTVLYNVPLQLQIQLQTPIPKLLSSSQYIFEQTMVGNTTTISPDSLLMFCTKRVIWFSSCICPYIQWVKKRKKEDRTPTVHRHHVFTFGSVIVFVRRSMISTCDSMVRSSYCWVKKREAQ